jgi:hypothetical protein
MVRRHAYISRPCPIIAAAPPFRDDSLGMYCTLHDSLNYNMKLKDIGHIS